MKVVAIIQARMGASRLPGKMLMDIAGKPAIAHVVGRVQKATKIDLVVVATTRAPADDAIVDWAKTNGVPCFRGSEQDVLDRYYQAAKEYGADIVVRVTGDCPVADPAVIDRIITAFEEGGVDYVSNTIRPTYPDGLDCEVLSFQALEKAWKEVKLNSEREHVTPYIWKHPELFKLSNVKCQVSGVETDLSAERWTLDTEEDLEFLRRVESEISGEDFSFQTTLRIVREHPEWRGLNAMHARNVGYEKSLKNDQLSTGSVTPC